MSSILLFLKSKLFLLLLVGFAATVAVVVVVTVTVIDVSPIKTTTFETPTEDGSGSDDETTTRFNPESGESINEALDSDEVVKILSAVPITDETVNEEFDLISEGFMRLHQS